MREAELLSALSQNQGGVSVCIEYGKVQIDTRYPNGPHVTVTGDNLFEAAFQCAQLLLKLIKDYPSYRHLCPKVVEALEAYDRHSQALQQ